MACAATFPDVAGARVTSETFARLALGRSTARYRDALTLARMLLEHRAPELRAGQAPVFAVLFDMNVLWERYVAALFRKAAQGKLEVVTQGSAALWREAGAGSRSVRPDLVVRSGKATLLIVDTKWKVAPDGVPGDADLHQMFVYNEIFRAPRAVLLYPSTGVATGRRGHFHGDRRHTCETMHLGVVAEHEWRGAQMLEQVERLLGSLEVSPNEAA